jgi:hypothetical protein
VLGNNIILVEQPRGRHIDGVAAVDNMIPGILVTPTTAARDAGGALTWTPWALSTGFQSLIAVVDYDQLQGQIATTTTQYKSGKRIKIYFPLPGEELNLLLAELAGTTGDPAIAIGDPLAAQTLTGRLIKTATGTAGGTEHQFIAAEALTVALGNEWLRVLVC